MGEAGLMVWYPEQVQNMGHMRVEKANVLPGALIKS